MVNISTHVNVGIDPLVDRDVRLAARALGRHGLAHAYGHCSRRLDTDHFLVNSAHPMALVPVNEAGTVVPVHGRLPDNVLGEVRIHQQIYARRPDVGGIARTQPPAVIALSTAGLVPSIRHGFGSYFHAGIALWEDPQLLREDASAAQLAQKLGNCSAISMRGNGVVVVAETLQRACVLTWYLEDAARLELSVRSAGLLTVSMTLDEDQSKTRATWAGRISERMWQFMTAGDPEGDLSGDQV